MQTLLHNKQNLQSLMYGLDNNFNDIIECVIISYDTQYDTTPNYIALKVNHSEQDIIEFWDKFDDTEVTFITGTIWIKGSKYWLECNNSDWEFYKLPKIPKGLLN